MKRRPRSDTPALPPRVRAGDTVAIVAPCSAEVFWPTHRGVRGSEYLERLGLRVKVMPHAGAHMAGKEVSPQDRAEDINAAFADPDVAVVLCSIGGNESIDILPYLDFEVIRGNPKIFQGLSDATVLHWAIHQWADLVTFHGPALLPELAEYPDVLEYTDRFLRASWFGGDVLSFEPASNWTDEFLDWLRRLDLERARELRRSKGWKVLRAGKATGRLVGGCLETISMHLLDADLLDFNGAVAFLETSELRPPPSEVKTYLDAMISAGVLRGVRGLVFGRPYGYSDGDKRKVWDVVAEVGAELGIPILADVDCGHTDPMLTLPFGLNATLDCDEGAFRMDEVATDAS